MRVRACEREAGQTVSDRQMEAATYLHSVTSLEPTPDEDSGERNRIAGGRY